MTDRPAWWPTAEQKVHADAACAHPDVCNIPGSEQAAAAYAQRVIVLGTVIPDLVEWARTGDVDAQDRAVALLEDNR